MKANRWWGALVAAGIVATLWAPEAALAQRRGPGGGGGSGNGGSAAADASSVKPYAEVITDKAETQPGLFLIHKIGEKLYYELPVEQLGRDMLWVTTLEQTQAGFSIAGMPVGDRVVRWEKRGDQILLRDVKYALRTDSQGALKQAVDATSVLPIIQVFPVAAYGTDQKPVIEVTELFTSDPSEFSAKQLLGAQAIDPKKTFIERVKSFPENVEVEMLASYRLGGGDAAAGARGPGRRGEDVPRDSTQSSVTAVVHHSMRLLPLVPMRPRRYDERVGFFTVGFQQFEDAADDSHAVENIQLITRWRLEKKDPAAAVSDPVQPIVFYVGREVPEKWQPFVKKGIEMWRPAFEAAGFSNAIEGRLAPSPQEDPNWDPEDARISTIRWLPSTTENAFGPHVHDPRTGEILEADVRMYHNVLKLARDWYFVQASPNDERAQKLPMPDEVVGELLAYIVAHEVGHSLGFPHNMKASAHYSVEQLRDPEFTAKFGTEASIMDYGRFNYVAQPGDGAALIPTVGPYDHFAVRWGYTQYADDAAEKEGQAALLAMQKDDPMLRFGDADPSQDPTRQTEDLGSDTVRATELGMANIDRVAGFLVSATCREGEDYDLLRNMYDQLIAQRNRELNHVTAVVGGFEQINLWYGDADRLYHPIPAEKQRQAVRLLIDHGLKVPAALVTPEILDRLEVDGAATRFLGAQRSLLSSLLSPGRIDRMTRHVESARAADPNADVYAPVQLIAELTEAIFPAAEPVGSGDQYRRNLQRAYVELLIERMEASSTTSDLPGLSRITLRGLEARLKHEVEDPIAAAHLADLSVRIRDAFEPKSAAAPAAAEAAGPPRRGGVD